MSEKKEILLRIASLVLLLPHVGLLVLAVCNVAGDLLLIPVSGQWLRLLDVTTGAIIGLGEFLTCLALWKPGKFTSFGWYSRIRVAAAGWNFLNGLWLANLVMKGAGLDRMQYGEMVLAFATLSALLIFAIEDKKS